MIANDLLPKGANPTTNKTTLNIKKVSKKLPIYRLYFFNTNTPLSFFILNTGSFYAYLKIYKNFWLDRLSNKE